jgi:N-hydroxyarylamine O-acetyltransferase
VSASSIDLDAYFERIGYDGGRAPTLDTLRAIHLRHPRAIAFENLNPLLQWPVPLDARSLEQKLVLEGRGGYCFEQNLLFAHALTALGFRITGLAGRVLWNNPPGAVTPRTHMLLLVDLGTPYIADVGFGGLTLTGPLRLQADVEQDTPHERFRLVRRENEWIVCGRTGNTWRQLYYFDLQPQLVPDYEVTNWYLSHHPESQFVTNLIAARPDDGRRHALRNCELTLHPAEGPTERRMLTTADELRRALEDTFRLNLPDSPALDEALGRIAAQAAAV